MVQKRIAAQQHARHLGRLNIDNQCINKIKVTGLKRIEKIQISVLQ